MVSVENNIIEVDFKDSLNRNKEAYPILFEIENILRFFIITIMTPIDPYWWKKLSNKELKDKCKKLLELEKERDGARAILMHEIYYTDIMDLYIIVKENWNHFSPILGGEDHKEFLYDIHKIRRIRNKVMHSKPITELEIKFIGSYKDHLFSTIKDYRSYRKFLNAYNYDGMYSSFKEELQGHLKLIKSKTLEGFDTTIYDIINKEWWYRDYIPLETKVCDSYYNDIKFINNKINEKIKGSRFDILMDIKAKKIKQNCKKLLNDYNA